MAGFERLKAELEAVGAKVLAASVDPVMIAIAVATTVLGTTLARRVLEAMNDTQYRLWANRIITVVCGYYVAHGTFLLVTA